MEKIKNLNFLYGLVALLVLTGITIATTSITNTGISTTGTFTAGNTSIVGTLDLNGNDIYDVNTIQLTSTSVSACSLLTAGQIYYNSTRNLYLTCNSKSWNPITNDFGVSSEGAQLYLASRSEDIDWTNLTNPTINDVSPNSNNNGKIFGKTLNHGNVDGNVNIENNYLNFKSVDGYIRIKDNFSLFSQFTYNIWVNYNGTTAESQKIISIRNITTTNIHSSISLSSIGNLEFTHRNQTTDEFKNTGIPLTTGWNLVTMQRTSNQLIYYINGVEIDRKTSVVDLGGLSGRLDIGKIATTNAQYYNGEISIFQIYNRDLSQSEITEIYNAGRDSYSPISDGLVAQYSGKDFAGTEATPTTIYDTNFLSAGHNEHTTAINFDGVNDYVDTGLIDNTPFTNNNGFSITGWLKPNVLNTGIIQNIISKADGISYSNGFGVYIRPSNPGLGVRINAGTAINTENIIINNEWVFYTVVVENNIATWYLNGVKSGTPSLLSKTSEITSINSVSIGNIKGFERYLNGSISQPLIKDYAMSQDEITALYNRQKVYFTDNNPAGRLGDYNIRGDLGVIGDTNLNGNDIFDVNTIQLTSTSVSSCSVSTEGQISYNSTTKHFYGCNSTNWNQLS